MTHFHVGQKVVCIDTWVGEAGCGCGDEVGPVEGAVYTIRGIGKLNPRFPDIVTVVLHEIINPQRFYQEPFGFGETSFAAYRFRPVIERKTSIEIFTAMLNKTTVRVTA